MKVFRLHPGAEPCGAFNHNKQHVGCLEATTSFSLVAFKAKQVANQPGPIEQSNVHRPLPQKSPGATEVNNIHEGYLPATDDAFASANVARIFSIR